MYNGPKWYSKLSSSETNGLLANVLQTPESIIICKQGEIYRGFALFHQIHTFINFLLKTPENERCFYEVISGSFPQKPYFDIDISDSNITESESLILIDEMKQIILKDSRIKFDDILVFSSHGETKLSYHIIITNWCLPDHLSNKNYCHKIIENIKSPLKIYIDSLVYKSIQQFRTFSSTKYGKDRFKILTNIPDKLKNENNRRQFFNIFLASLVSNTKSCCVLEYTESIKKNIYDQDLEDISEKEINIIKDLEFIKDSTFDIQDVKGRLIVLKRNKSSFCVICKRDHESENPFLIFEKGKISFHCRRSIHDRQVIWEEPTEISQKQINKTLFLKKFLGKR